MTATVTQPIAADTKAMGARATEASSDLGTTSSETVPGLATADDTLSIDMLDPSQVCHRLNVDAERLLMLVNRAILPAYDLGGSIRFRRRDVVLLRAA